MKFAQSGTLFAAHAQGDRAAPLLPPHTLQATSQLRRQANAFYDLGDDLVDPSGTWMT
jgi:hypothetical protein